MLTVARAETDCPVCGLGDAFHAALHYDVCARCGWVDDPAAYRDPEQRCETNDDSLNGAKRSWPGQLAQRLAAGPRSTFAIAIRDDEIGGYDYLVDGVSVRDMFPTGRWNLKASIGPWPVPGDWCASLRSGVPDRANGRSRLYVCHLCGSDDDEAELTADVVVGADCVLWTRIGLEEPTFTPDHSIAGWTLDLRHGPAGFAFNTEEYLRALSL